MLLDLFTQQPAPAKAEGRTSIADDLVLASQAGTPLKPDNYAGWYMQPALTKAGLRKYALHDLRHTYGSLLITLRS